MALAAQPEEKSMANPFIDLNVYSLWEVPMDKVVSSTPGPMLVTEMIRASNSAVACDEARRRRPGYAPRAGFKRLDNGRR